MRVAPALRDAVRCPPRTDPGAATGPSERTSAPGSACPGVTVLGSTDPLLTIALQMVHDEQVAKSSSDALAAQIRHAATYHAIGAMTLAAEQGRAVTKATVLPDGRVVIAVELRTAATKAT